MQNHIKSPTTEAYTALYQSKSREELLDLALSMHKKYEAAMQQYGEVLAKQDKLERLLNEKEQSWTELYEMLRYRALEVQYWQLITEYFTVLDQHEELHLKAKKRFISCTSKVWSIVWILICRRCRNR